MFIYSGGYGAKILKLRRDPLSMNDSNSEFPLILGRDVSGVVVDCGSEVTNVAPGDEVGTFIITEMNNTMTGLGSSHH